MKLSHLIFGLIICAGTLSAGTTHAYFTTKQTVRTFNPDTELFTITYHFGATDKDFYLPITALRDTSNTSNKNLGYSIVDESGKTSNIGSTTALVLSHAQIKDGRYFVPAGTSSDFTLVTILHRPPHTSTVPYRLLVTALPFTMNIRGTLYENHLNPSELQYYITPPLYRITVSYTTTK
jgi:hypothetical protein